jgi:ABC-type polysaccharide/polyol phosphate export permease
MILLILGAHGRRETGTRFADTRLGYGWALLGPMQHVALLWVTLELRFLTHKR